MTFDKEDAFVLMAFLKQLLIVETLQISTAKYFLKKFDTLEKINLVRNRLGLLEDADSAALLRAELEGVEQEYAKGNIEEAKRLRDGWARLEQDQEPMEAMIATFEKMIKNPPPSAQQSGGAAPPGLAK